MELVLVLLMIAIVLGITPPLDRGHPVEEVWPETSFE
jgi:hypothetical protein